MPSGGDLGRASIVLLFIFAGIESALTPSGEVRDPARSVPRAVLLALVIVTVFYMLIQIAAQGVLGSTLPGRSAPLVDVAEATMGKFGARLIGAGLVLSAFGYLCGMILAAPRALFALSRDGVLPLSLSNVHERYHTPWIAIIVQAALALTVALFMQSFEKLAILANVSVLIVYFGCAAAAWQLRRRDIREDTSVALISLPGSRIAPPLTMLIIVALLTTVTRAEWYVAGACLAAGIVLYAISLVPRGTRRPAPLARRP